MEKIGPKLAITMGMGLLLYSTFVYAKIESATKWPTTMAKIRDVGDDYVHYVYSVSGKQYESKNIDFLGWLPSGHLWDRTIVYLYKNEHKIWFNPDDPNESALELESPPAFLAGLVSIVIVGIGFVKL